MFRDMCTVLGTPFGSDCVRYVKIISKSKQKPILHPVILPHLLFRKIYEDKDLFGRIMLGGHSNAGWFWQNCKDFVSGHPTLKDKSRSELRKIIPLGFHGDGGAFSEAESVVVISWNSLIGAGSAKDTRLVFTFVKKSDLDTEAYNILWRVFSWSMNCLLSGKFPTEDWLGRIDTSDRAGGTLAENFAGATVLMRGDWQFYSEVMQFPRHNEVRNNCYLCQAGLSNPALRYSDASPAAGWCATCRTNSYAAELAALGRRVPVLLDTLIGLDIRNIMVDVLHAVDLGVGACVIGNILAEVLPQFGANQKERLANLNAELQRWYSYLSIIIHNQLFKIISHSYSYMLCRSTRSPVCPFRDEMDTLRDPHTL